MLDNIKQCLRLHYVKHLKWRKQNQNKACILRFRHFFKCVKCLNDKKCCCTLKTHFEKICKVHRLGSKSNVPWKKKSKWVEIVPKLTYFESAYDAVSNLLNSKIKCIFYFNLSILNMLISSKMNPASSIYGTWKSLFAIF